MIGATPVRVEGIEIINSQQLFITLRIVVPNSCAAGVRTSMQNALCCQMGF